MTLAGASPNPQIVGLNELAGKSNYFLGNNPARWRTNVSNYARVKYRSVYPGVDLVYHGNQRQLEYDFVVAPGADPNEIRLTVAAMSPSPAGGQRPPLQIAPNGDLVIDTSEGSIKLRKPVVYQESGQWSAVSGQLRGAAGSHPSAIGNRKFLDGRFVLLARNEVGFEVSGYDRKEALIIDPALSISTYLGGSSDDTGFGIAVDSSGAIYVTGSTGSSDFPTATPLQTADAGGDDAFIAKLDPTAASLVYSTYLGGTGSDQGNSIAIDSSGNAYIAGSTGSLDFPTSSGAFQKTYGGDISDGFVTELSADGSSLVYSTYLGGNGADFAQGIALDASGNAYVTGQTASTDFPTKNPIQAANAGGVDAFVTELSAGGGSLVYSTYLGGSGADAGQAIALDSSGAAYIAGSTLSTDFPTLNPLQSSNVSGKLDAFVAKLNAAGSALVYSTYLGGSGSDGATAIAVDSSASAYVTGDTTSTDFPVTSGVFQAANLGGGDAFVAKLDPAGSALSYATFLGGSAGDRGNGIAVDPSGDAFVTGYTQSSDFPTANAPQAAFGGGTCNSAPCFDAFVTELNPTATGLIYSTFLGGSSDDLGQAIALDGSGDAFVTGQTSSTNFPVTAGVIQNAYGGQGPSGDAFVAKIVPANLASAILAPQSITFPDQGEGSTSAPITVTLSDFGTTAINVSSIATSGDFAVDASATTCSTSTALAPNGASCTINVTFTPTTTTAETGSLTITDDAPGSPQTVALAGTGVTAAPAVTLSSTSLTFPDELVGATSPSQTVTVTNSGSATLSITKVSTTGDYAETDNCVASIAPGGSCAASVTFTPTASGTDIGTLVFEDNASNSPQAVKLSGNGIANFSVSASPTTLNEANEATSATVTVSVSAPSSFTDSVALSCSGGSGATCSYNPASIKAGQTSTLTIGSLGSVTANPDTLTVVGTDGKQSASVDLTINFADFSLAIAPPLLTIPAGQSGSYKVTLTPSNGFNVATSFSCSTSPSLQQGTCTVSPSSVTPDGTNPSSVTVTITTTARSAGPPNTGWRILPPPFPGGFAAFALLALFFAGASLGFSRQRTKARVWVGLAALLLWVTAWASCGNVPPAPPGTQAGDYVVIVTAKTSTLTHVTSANLVVD